MLSIGLEGGGETRRGIQGNLKLWPDHWLGVGLGVLKEF